MAIPTSGAPAHLRWRTLPLATTVPLATLLLATTLLPAVAVQPAIAQDLQRAAPEEVGMSSARLERLSHALQAYVDNGEVAGTAPIVVRRGKIVYLEAFGQRDRESRSPMTTDAIFRIASQTKAPISVGIMMLQEEGKLLITDQVGKYLDRKSVV